MRIEDLNTIYSRKEVEQALAMQGAGWSSEDSVEDLLHDFDNLSINEAKTYFEIIEKLEEIEEEEN